MGRDQEKCDQRHTSGLVVWWLSVARRQRASMITDLLQCAKNPSTTGEAIDGPILDTNTRTFTRTEQRSSLGSPVPVDLRLRVEVSPVHPRRVGLRASRYSRLSHLARPEG